jgi:hypothetical protein
MKSNNWTFTRSDVYIDFNGNRVSKKQWLQNIPEDVIVASMTNPTTPPKPPVVGYKPKINPATGQPYKINPKTGLPFKKKKVAAAVPTPKAAPVAPSVFNAIPNSALKPATPKDIINNVQKLVEALEGKGYAATAKPKPAPKPKVCCPECKREMSATLDTYYGKTPNAEKYCSPCRRVKFHE